jgi:hypothetical protein
MKLKRLWMPCLLAVLCSLTACATSGEQRWKARVQKCYQSRDVPLADWPERLEDFPVAGLQWLGVIREERRLEKVERECIADL